MRKQPRFWTFTVNRSSDERDNKKGDGRCDSSSDPGDQCTFWAAIDESNASPGLDAIHFSVTQVLPGGPIPNLSEGAVIDGTTSGGIVDMQTYIAVYSGGTVVRGLALWEGSGVIVKETTDVLFEGNYVGTDATATQVDDADMRLDDVREVVIGGTVEPARNLIVGNGDGIVVWKETSGDIEFLGNWFGLDPTGSEVLGGLYQGIRIFPSGSEVAAASGVTIGGLGYGSRNVFANTLRGTAISIDSASDLAIRNNFVGTDDAGDTPLGWNLGLYIRNSNGVTIGGAAPGSGNVVSATKGTGVKVIDSSVVLIQRNFVGTDALGTAALGNGSYGIELSGSPGTIGGEGEGLGNIVAAAAYDGINLSGSPGSFILGNHIGTDLTGSLAWGNGRDGIRIGTGTTNVVIGAPGAGNVIASNLERGILATSLSGGGNTIQSNRIGVGLDGTALGNLFEGVALTGLNSLVGGEDSAKGNIVGFNGKAGVSIFGSDTEGNGVLTNSIFANGGLGIDTGVPGVARNDDWDDQDGNLRPELPGPDFQPWRRPGDARQPPRYAVPDPVLFKRRV